MQLQQAVHQAKLSAIEVANLAGVSRVTATKWRTGRPVHKLAKDRVGKLVKAIELALKDGSLPLHVDETNRLPIIRKILVEKLRLISRS